MSIESVMTCNHLILCHALLLLPSIFPTIRIFFNELAIRIRWPKYWSFSFIVSLSNKYSGLISFRIDLFDLLAVLCPKEGLQKKEPDSRSFSSVEGQGQRNNEKERTFYNLRLLFFSGGCSRQTKLKPNLPLK